MVRTLSVATVLLFSLSSSTANAQASERPGVMQRFQSLFQHEGKPKHAPKTAASPDVPQGPRPPKQESQPVRVTTRSGSLRRPGPEKPSLVTESPTPTFAPREVARDPRSPRRFTPESASELPQPGSDRPRSIMRDRAVAPAAFEAPAPKKTMASWFRGLWSGDKVAPPVPPMHQPNPTSSRPRALERSSSIDPSRVYRGPQSEPNAEQRRSSNTTFSETGVPQSTTDFQGRAGIGF